MRMMRRGTTVSHPLTSSSRMKIEDREINRNQILWIWVNWYNRNLGRKLIFV
jgi:hypothetical protein